MSWLISQALMNSHFSQEQWAVSSAGNFSDGEQSVPLNGNPIQQAYCSPDKMTVFSRLSRFGMTFKPLTENLGEELLTLYLAGFHAQTSVQQKKTQKDLTEKPLECGVKWRGWLAKFNPDTFSWKTAQCSLLEDSTECLQTLPRSGMTRNGLLWDAPNLEQNIKETEFGLWGTPTTSQDFKPVRKLAPSEASGKHGTILVGSIGKEHPHLIGRYLKPLVTEYLMGWPTGWTDLKPLEMGKFPFVQQQLGKS
jgi:hypothetical protein